MANTLRFKRGLLAGLPSAAVGEPLFTTDTFDLYIGTASGTQKYQKFIASGTTSQLLRGDGSLLTMPIVLTSPANGEVLKYNGTNWVNSSDAGITGSGVAGQVAYFTGATTQGGSNNLFWDASNNRLGIGTNAPAQALHVSGTARIGNTLATNGATTIEQVYVGDQVLGVVSARYGSGALLLGYGAKAKNGADGYVSSFDNFSARRSVLDINQGYFDFLNTASVNTARGSDLTTSLLMRLSTGGNLILNSASDNGLRFQVTGDGFFSGAVGIGQTALTGSNFRISKTLTGSASAINFYIDSVIQSDVTNSPKIIATTLSTQAAAFTIPIVSHFYANQGSIGAGSAITTQIGFQADNTLTGATNNYGFYGNIASGTGRWNLYMSGTAANYLAGTLSIGTTITDYRLNVAAANLSTIGMIDTAEATDQKRWVFQYGTTVGAGTFRLRAINDANSNGENAYVITRSGIAVQTHQWLTANTERMRLDASGNLGLGVTPSAWFNTIRAIQIGNVGGAFLSGNTVGGGSASIGLNAHFDNATSSWIYGTSHAASWYQQTAGQHRWYNAPSGTAGNAITFTQAMTLDASGNLGIGTTNPLDRLHVNNGDFFFGNESNVIQNIRFRRNAATVGSIGTYGNQIEINGGSTLGAGHLAITSGGSVILGFTGSSTGEKLQVNGTMRVSGASTLTGNVGIGTSTDALFPLKVQRSTAGGIIEAVNTTTYAQARLVSGGTNQNTYLTFNPTGTGTAIIQINDIDRISIASTGAATFSSSVTANGNLFVGTQAFSIDVASNRVAINKSSPTRRLDIGGTVGDFQVYDSGAEVYFTRNANNDIYADGGTSAGLTLGGRSYLAFKTGTASLTERMRLDASGNLGIGGTPAQKLDVTGSANSVQARFGNVAGRGLTIGTSAISGTNDAGVVFNAPTATDGTLIFQTTSVERARISGSGNLLINTTSDTGYKLRVNGTSYFDDNLRFPNLKGCVFVQTGGSLLGSIAMDSANAVTIDNNGFAGLSVGGSYTMTGGNLGIGHSAFGTSATKTISVNSGTAPSTSPADAFQLYSADITAGNAAPHFRTENGGIIKLYQQTTAVTSATYIGGAGTTVTDLDTFDGYTIPQIVKALRNAGLLA